MQRPRVAGHNLQAARYLARELEGLGYLTRVERVPFRAWTLRQDAFLSIDGNEIGCLPIINSCGGKFQGILGGPEEFLTYDEQYRWTRWPVVHEGKIVGYLMSGKKNFLTVLDEESAVPHLMACAQGGKRLLRGSRVQGKLRVSFEERHLYNVITAPRTKRGIMICAHYDTMPGTTGGSDNTSGVVALLGLARRMSARDDVQFALFDGEELNKKGSYAHVRKLGPKGLQKIKAVISIDNVACKGGILYCERSQGFLGKIPALLPRHALRGTSDHWPFHKKGIPVLRIGCAPNKHIHTARDDAHNISLGKIRTVAAIVEEIVGSL